MSEYSLKGLLNVSDVDNNMRNRANFLPCIVQFDWLISDQ